MQSVIWPQNLTMSAWTAARWSLKRKWTVSVNLCKVIYEEGFLFESGSGWGESQRESTALACLESEQTQPRAPLASGSVSINPQGPLWCATHLLCGPVIMRLLPQQYLLHCPRRRKALRLQFNMFSLRLLSVNMQFRNIFIFKPQAWS